MQTTHNTSPDVAYEGMVADLGPNDIVSATTDDTNGAISFGKFVVIRTLGDPPVVELPDATGEVTGNVGFGIVVADIARETPGDSGFGDHAQISVLRRGRIWVKSETQVTAKTPAFVRFNAGGNGIGSFRTDADTANAVALPGAMLLTPCAANGLTLLEFWAQK